jgi:hypothetical protein
MNKMYHLSTLLGLMALAISLSSCFKDECDSVQIFYRYDPVYLTEAQIRQNIEIAEPRELRDPGKIYFYQNYVLINEQYEGIHIIDNSDPANPTPVSFVTIPGNIDLAVRGDILYADSYIDLLSIDISNPRSPQFLSRSESVFPSLGFDPSRGHIVRYERTEVTREMPCNNNDFFFFQNDVLFARPEIANVDFAADAGGARAQAALGVGGSLARFTLAKDHLYAVDQSNLNVFSLRNPQQPDKVNNVYIGWAIETIFPFGDNLFIGGRNGMFVMSNKDPRNPTMIGVFEHANACDPVFVVDDVAFVTLRDGSDCENFTNQLDIVDMSNVAFPQLMHSFPMHHPIGLSVLGDHLYLCEDDQGLKVFEISDLSAIPQHQVAHLKGFTALDVITLPSQEIALVVGRDGFYQFDISDPLHIEELSFIPVAGE